MRFITFYFLLISLTFNIQAQWRPLNSFTERVWLNSVYFTDDDHGWIAGSNGTILKFDSELFNWNKINTPAAADLKSIGFFDNSAGAAVGINGMLLVSADGGENWTIKSSGTSGNLNKIFILDQNTGFISGDNGLLLKTTNKGNTWTQINIPTTKNLTSIFFVNNNLGFAGTDSTSIIRTTDGGLTWSEQEFVSFFPLTINAIYFCDNFTGYSGGGLDNLGSIFLKTTDGGVTWNYELLANPAGNIRSFHFRDPHNGVISGGDNTWNRFLQIKKNGGYQTVIFHNEDYDIMSVIITQSGKGWAVGGGASIFYTENFTENWAQVYGGSEDIPQAISASYDNNLYLESLRNNFRDPEGVTIGSYNDFLLWKDISQYRTYDNIINLKMIDSMYGFKISDFGVLFKTTNGASSWDFPQFFNEDQAQIFFIARSTGWLYKNNIYKTTTGSDFWNLIYTSSFTLTDLMFVNPSIGYACGSDDSLNGKVIKSTDGGNSWNEMNIPAVGHLTSVSFANPDTGIVTGWGSTILRTYNGGQTWTPVVPLQKQSFTEKYYLKPVKAKNDKRFIINNNKAEGIYKVTEADAAVNYLDAVFKDNYAFIASDSGAVLESTDYGNTWKTNQIGSPVLEVEFNGLQHAIARVEGNLYIAEYDRIVPVELLSFTVSHSNSGALLEWSTATERNNSGFEIEKNSGESWIKIDFVQGKGTTTEKNYYSYIDKNIEPLRNISYRLKQIDYSGEYAYSPEVTLYIQISDYALEQNYPNPFNPVTKIKYTLPQKEPVKITITDALGRETAVIEDSEKDPGIYEFEFNGSSLSSGVYFYTIRAGRYISTKKMVLLK